jgi:hypothetical protein
MAEDARLITVAEASASTGDVHAAPEAQPREGRATSPSGEVRAVGRAGPPPRRHGRGGPATRTA